MSPRPPVRPSPPEPAPAAARGPLAAALAAATRGRLAPRALAATRGRLALAAAARGRLAPAALVAAALALLAPASPAAPRPAPSGPIVLHVGDSFVASGLAQALRPRFEALGLRYFTAAKTSAFIPTLPADVRLRTLVANYRPVLVLITLGANDITAFDPEGRAAAVRSLVALLGPIPCLWTLPPPWKDDERSRTLLRVIEREAAPCRTFDATPFAHQIRRTSDGIHPSAEGGAYWAEVLWAWLGVADPDPAP
ncbi:MAG TPA: SGNH/GDSL hydrolase family protein [Polyangiaceae bacterium]|nr:SGNH/GDSL hydrolase family protein [Polyangiaceae bacterium]